MEETFEKFEKYDWEEDSVYQQGIASILSKYGPESDAAQKARFWYFSKYVEPIDVAQYQAWKSRTSQEASESTATQPATEALEEEGPRYPKTFFELCDMLAKGIPIPGIRQIPDKLADGEPSQPSLPPARKPWEKTPAE